MRDLRDRYVEGQKVDLVLELLTIRQFESYGFSYNDDITTSYLYKCIDEFENIIVWVSSKFVDIGKHSKIRVQGTVKAIQNYRGEDQVVLRRVKVEVLQQRGSAEDMWKHEQDEYEAQKKIDKERKKREQQASITPKDEVIRVKYRDYKNKYPDAETVIDSYDSSNATIEIILRNGSR